MLNNHEIFYDQHRFLFDFLFTSVVFAMEDQTLYRGESSSVTRLILPEAGYPFEIVNPCTDFGFKRAFCNSDVLIDF